MTTPIRIQLSRRKGWKMPPNTVKVDRSSLFGNPFAVSKGWITGGELTMKTERYFVGDTFQHFATKHEAMQKAVEYFVAHMNSPRAWKQRELVKIGLRGKNLACWCPLDQPCHADVLLELANK
jgi:hypothetical protein